MMPAVWHGGSGSGLSSVGSGDTAWGGVTVGFAAATLLEAAACERDSSVPVARFVQQQASPSKQMQVVVPLYSRLMADGAGPSSERHPNRAVILLNWRRELSWQAVSSHQVSSMALVLAWADGSVGLAP